MYSTLVKFPIGNLTQVRPSVASSWDVSSDGRTFTFHLRRGIKFSSGNRLTADDVLYSFQRVVTLPKDPASWLITQMGIDDKSVATAVTAPDPVHGRDQGAHRVQPWRVPVDHGQSGREHC